MTDHHHANGIDPRNGRRRTGRWRLLSVVILLTLGGGPTASAAEELDKILARPISTGSIALLWAHVTASAAHARLCDALKDSRPDVRAVAARVAHNSKVQAVLPELRAALETETDPSAATELVRAVLVVGGPATYADAVTAAVRLRGGPALTVVETFARLGSRELLTHLERLAATRVDDDVLAKAVVAVTKGDTAARLALLRAPFVVSDRGLLVKLLAELRADGTAVPPDLFLSWLQGEETLRVEAIWQIAQTIEEGGPSAISSDVMTALAPRVEAAKREVSWEALGLELIARMTGPRTTARSWRGLPDPRPATIASPMILAAFDVLNEAERGELSEMLFGTRDRLDKPKVMPADSGTKAAAAAVPVVVSGSPILGSLWRDLYAITDCKPPRTARTALAEIAYHPDGRPQRMGIGPADLSAGCQSMVRTLFSLHVARLTEPISTAYRELALIPFNDGALACASEPMSEETDHDPEAAVNRSKPGRITPPKKTQDTRPVYPESAQRERVQGLVLVEAIITPTGCIARGHVTRSVDPRLDIEALLAMMSWRYTPALLDNRPVKVVMTVSVNFTLR